MTPADPFEIPSFLRVTPEEAARRRQYWKGRRLRYTREMNFTDPAERTVQDPGTIRLLAEKAAAEKARAKEKALADKEARLIKAKQRASRLKTDGDDDMAKKAKKSKRTAKNPRQASRVKAKKTLERALGRKLTEKQVTTRFKASGPKPDKPLAKPRPARAPRSSKVHVVDAPLVLGKAGKAALEAAGHSPGDKIVSVDAPKPKKAKTAKEPKAPKGDSKAAKLEKMLRHGTGVTLAEVAEQMGWLPHTTRAAISRVAFEVSTEKKDGVTVYHIPKDAPAKAGKADAKGS